MRRTPIRSRRRTPRRRDAPRWTAADWEANEPILQQRAGGRCECCGEAFDGEPVERHHRIRRRDGGDRLSNLLMLRRDHHAYWTEHPEQARGRGIILAVGSDPTLQPLWQWNHRMVLLDDFGGLTPT